MCWTFGWTQYRHSTDTVQTQHRHSTDTAQTQQRHGTDTAQRGVLDLWIWLDHCPKHALVACLGGGVLYPVCTRSGSCDHKLATAPAPQNTPTHPGVDPFISMHGFERVSDSECATVTEMPVRLSVWGSHPPRPPLLPFFFSRSALRFLFFEAEIDSAAADKICPVVLGIRPWCPIHLK